MISEAYPIRPLRNEEDHQRALSRVDTLMAAKPGTPEFDELDVLATLVEAYERRHFPMRKPTPAEAIRFRMEQLGLSPEALSDLVGSSVLASEILAGKRSLDLRAIKRLRQEWGIPADILLGEEAA